MKDGQAGILAHCRRSRRNVERDRFGIEARRRGLAPGSSLAKLLERERGVRNKRNLLPLTHAQILAWADDYKLNTGEWPSTDSGQAPDGETWLGINLALREGLRALPGDDSLLWLLRRERNVDHRRSPHEQMPEPTPGQLRRRADELRGRGTTSAGIASKLRQSVQKVE